MKKRKLLFVNFVFAICFCLSMTTLVSCSNDNKMSYDVGSDCFTYITFEPKTFTSIVNHEESNDYVIKVNGKCSVSLYEFTAEVTIYSNTNTVLYKEKITRQQDVLADKEFFFYVNVTQKIQTQAKRVRVVYSGKSYESPKPVSKNYTVTFVYNNGKDSKTTTVTSDEKLNEPIAPTKKNHIFDCWCTDQALTVEYDFTKTVSRHLTLYAKYDVDYKTLTNTIMTTTMKSNVTVYAKSYNDVLGIETAYAIMSGSGIIFHDNGSGTYFLLTNNHVTCRNRNYSKVKYEVEDYRGNKYTAYLKHEEASYDLAVLYFKKTTELGVIELGDKNPAIGTEVISLGQPHGQSNAVTYGECNGYNRVIMQNAASYQSNVTFNALLHNCQIDSGSSGGAVLDTNLKLVGINYGGASSIVMGCAVPIEKVNEFLNLYVWGK